jgi:hypothetical protein
VALAGRRWEIFELELGTGGGAWDSAVGSTNTDAGGRGVAVVEGGVLGEVDAGGSSVCYAGVADWKMGLVRDGWAAGQ